MNTYGRSRYSRCSVQLQNGVTVSVSVGRHSAIAPSVVSSERSAILYDELRA